MVIMVASLMGQAAYIRSRIDATPPPMSVNQSITCSACNPAVRAYSLAINVKGMRDAKVTQTLSVRNLFGVCKSGNKSTPTQFNDGTANANWIVLSATPGSASLLSDVANGYTQYIVIFDNTYVILTTIGSTAESKMRAGSKNIKSTDVLFLIQTVNNFKQSYIRGSHNAIERECEVVMARAPVFTMADSLTDPLLTEINNSTQSDTMYVQGWGYAGASQNAMSLKL